MKYMLIVLCGIWQILTVLSLGKAVYELANPKKRHFWDKTSHGHDLPTLELVTASPNPAPVVAAYNVIPLRQAAVTRSVPETRNIGAAISGRLRRP